MLQNSPVLTLILLGLVYPRGFSGLLLFFADTGSQFFKREIFLYDDLGFRNRAFT